MSADFFWTGGCLSLDYCNTGDGHYELITDSGRLARWFEDAGLVGASRPAGAAELARALELRDRLRGSLTGRDPTELVLIAERWLEPLELRVCIDHATLTPRPAPRQNTALCALGAVVLDALEVARGGLNRVRECAGESCPALFLDLSRNRSRRWCTMSACGARAKSRTYYRRHRPPG